MSEVASTISAPQTISDSEGKTEQEINVIYNVKEQLQEEISFSEKIKRKLATPFISLYEFFVEPREININENLRYMKETMINGIIRVILSGKNINSDAKISSLIHEKKEGTEEVAEEEVAEGKIITATFTGQLTTAQNTQYETLKKMSVQELLASRILITERNEDEKITVIKKIKGTKEDDYQKNKDRILEKEEEKEYREEEMEFEQFCDAVKENRINILDQNNNLINAKRTKTSQEQINQFANKEVFKKKDKQSYDKFKERFESYKDIGKKYHSSSNSNKLEMKKDITSPFPSQEIQIKKLITDDKETIDKKNI